MCSFTRKVDKTGRKNNKQKHKQIYVTHVQTNKQYNFFKEVDGKVYWIFKCWSSWNTKNILMNRGIIIINDVIVYNIILIKFSIDSWTTEKWWLDIVRNIFILSKFIYMYTYFFFDEMQINLYLEYLRCYSTNDVLTFLWISEMSFHHRLSLYCAQM